MPDYPQQPSDETVAAVAAVLVHFRYVNDDQLNWADQTTSIRSGLSIAQFFDIPESRKQHQFLRDLSGHYVALKVSDPFALQVRLILNHLPSVKSLIATEVIDLYRSPGIGELISSAQLTGAKVEAAFREAAKEFGWQAIAEQTATGHVLAFVDLVSIFLKASSTGFSSIIGGDELVYDQSDRMIAIAATRNSGWTARYTNDLGLPPTLDHQTHPRRVVRILANDPQFFRVDGGEEVDPAKTPLIKTKQRSKSFFDSETTRGSLPDSVAEILYRKAESADHKLAIAIEYGELSLFTDALSAGADPNMIPQGSDTPLMFLLAKNGQLEWAKALIETGRYRPAKDELGQWPSTYAGQLCRQIATTTGAEDLRVRYGELYNLLNVEEEKQMNIPEHDTP
ncbi:MAG: hypothetical protein AAFY56_15995 [Pseudomonadota bacterium]